MSEIILLKALSGLITLGLFLFFFYGPWQAYVTDVTRQRLFELRDKLFDYALDHPEFKACVASGQIRELLNSMIRFAHEIDVVHFTAMITYLATGDRKVILLRAAGNVDNVIKSIPEAFRDDVRQIVKDAHVVILWHFYRRSLFLITATLVLVLPTIVLLVMMASTGNMVRIITRKFGKFVNALAYEDSRSHRRIVNC